MLHIHTLGGLRLMLDGQPVAGFISRKVEALLVYLACNPREHPREILAEMLWDDLSQERTMANLRQTLSDLQKQLAPFLLVSRQSIGINPDSPYSLDISVLNGALSALDKHSGGDLNRALVTQLDEALAVYHGDFLVGFNIRSARGFEGWRLLETERLRGRVMEALLRLSSYALKRQTYNEGIAYASRLVNLDPLSEEAHRLLMTLYALSGQRVSALAQYETCRKILLDELDLEPEDETVELYEQLRENRLAAKPVSETPHNLVLPSTPFVPRPELQRHVQAALSQPESRLVTLVGSSGSGKTRLALAVATEQIHHFPDGVFFVSFAAVQQADRIAQVICNTLQIDQQGGISLEKLLVKYLAERELLLVLDNLEQLVEGVDILSDLLAKASGIKILATSIERLNLLEEWVIPVGGMSLPEDELDFEQHAAVQMFIQSAKRASLEFSPQPHLPVIAEICRFVNGNALGIELAASWVRLMPCEQILTEMQQSIDFLTSTLRNLPERHRSMRGILEALWRQLTPEERSFTAQLSIFTNGFTHEAAREIIGLTSLDLARLVDKSILNVIDGRYDIHPLLLKFLMEKLRLETSEMLPISQRHSHHYGEFLAKRESFLDLAIRNSEVNAIARDMENMLQGLRYALLMGDEATVGLYIRPLYFLYSTLNRYYEAADIFREIVDQLNAGGGAPETTLSRTQVEALVRCAISHHFINRYDEAEAMLLYSLPSLRLHDDREGLRLALKTLAVLFYAQGDYATSKAYYQELLGIAHETNNVLWTGNALFGLGSIALVEGDYSDARRLLVETRSALQIEGNVHDRIQLLTTLGDLDCKLGYFEEAALCFEESLYLATESSGMLMQGIALVSMGRVAYGQGRYEESKDFCRRSIERCDSTRNIWGKAFALTHLARAYYRLGDYTGARYHLRKALDLCDQIGNRWVKAFALRQNGRALFTIDAPDPYLMESLRLALEMGALPLMLDALTGIAAIAAARNQVELTARLAYLVKQHPISEYETLLDAQAALEQVLPLLSPAEQDELERQAQAQTVEQVARELLIDAERV